MCEYTVRVLAWVTRREDRYWHKDGGGGGERGGHIEGVLLWANRQTIRTSTEREVLSPGETEMWYEDTKNEF